MFPGVLALLERSLRVDARAWGPHLTRFGLMVAIYLAVSYASATSGMFGAPGLRFFQSIAYLNLVFMTLMGIGFFSTAITEEKEEDTLGLMLMAGISPLGILLGKSVGRLMQALLLIAVQYPFTLLAVTMGGVTQHQIRSVYVALFSYLVMLAGVGLLCSTLATRNRSATTRMMIVLAVYVLVPYFWRESLSTMGSTGLPFAWIAETSVFLQLSITLTTGFDETLFSYQVITNLLIGISSFILSWAMFGQAVRDVSTEAVTRGFLGRNRGPIRVFAPGRPRFNPFIWKDFHFVAGGIAGVLMRTVLYVLLYPVVFEVTQLLIGGLRWGPPSWDGTTGIYLTLLMFAITFDAGLLISRSLHEEVRGQTFATLMLVPSSSGMILYSKTIGSLLVWLPGPVCMVLGILYLPNGSQCAADFFRRPGPPLLFISHFILVPHAAAIAALFARWGALAVGIGVSVGVAVLSFVFISTFRVSPEDASVFVIGYAILLCSAACHFAVWRRANVLALG